MGCKEWHRSEITRLPPRWPMFKSLRWHHVRVDFVVGSDLLCSKRFSLVLQFSPHLKNQHFQISTRSVMHWHFLTSSSELVSALWITLIPSLLILQATGFGEKSHHRKWRNLLCCTRYKTESGFFQTEVRGSWCKVLMFSKSVNFHFLWYKFNCRKHVHVKLCIHLYSWIPCQSVNWYAPRNRVWVLGLPCQASIAYRVRTESWILKKVLKFAQHFSRTGKICKVSS